MGVAPQELEQIKLNLDFAELALESGQARRPPSSRRARRVEQAEAASLKELAYRARFLIARALEAQGMIDDAVIELETLLLPAGRQRAADQGRHRPESAATASPATSPRPSRSAR